MAGKLLDLLLNMDAAKLKLPTREVEIRRLSEICGEKFVVTCMALTPGKYEEIQEAALTVTGKDVDVDVNEMQVQAVIEGVCDDGGKLICKNRDLMEQFKAPTPKELAYKLFLSGEISKLYNTISELSGFGEGAVQEVKN